MHNRTYMFTCFFFVSVIIGCPVAGRDIETR
jgi:hypothetical protein